MTISDGDWSYLFQSNVSIVIWMITLLGFVLPLIFGKKIKDQINRLKSKS